METGEEHHKPKSTNFDSFCQSKVRTYDKISEQYWDIIQTYHTANMEFLKGVRKKKKDFDYGHSMLWQYKITSDEFDYYQMKLHEVDV